MTTAAEEARERDPCIIYLKKLSLSKKLLIVHSVQRTGEGYLYHISQGIGGDHPLLSIFIESTSLRREVERRMLKCVFGIPLSYESLVCVDRYAEEEGEIEYGNGPENQRQKSSKVKIGNPRTLNEFCKMSGGAYTECLENIASFRMEVKCNVPSVLFN